MRLVKIEPTPGDVTTYGGMHHTRRQSGPLWLHHDAPGGLTLEDNRDRPPGGSAGSMTHVNSLSVRWGGKKNVYAAMSGKAADRYAANPDFHAVMSNYHFGAGRQPE